MTRRRLAAISTAAILTAVGPSAYAQQIVYDPTSYAKLIEQAQTALQQLQQLKAQLQQGQRLYDGFNQASGVNSLAALLNTPQLRAVLPDAATFAQAGTGNLAGLGALGTLAAQIRGANRLYTAPAGDPVGQALDASGDRAARDLALGETVTDAGAQRLAGLQQLQGALDTAPNARAVMDLQARLEAEQAMIANDQMRLQGLAMTQAAQERLAVQQDKERAAAAYEARMRAYRMAFQ